ncbi:MAG: sialidase family protein [Kiritimatiellaeota bacterium]|nr:sialidase family protein [Kiritimatiellota bacterium]
MALLTEPASAPAAVAEKSARAPNIVAAATRVALPGRRHITIPAIDLSGEANPADFKRHVVLAGGTAQADWQHPHMLLMPDGHTLFAVWTRGHGGTCGPLKRSDDAGLTWSGLLDVPENWPTARNCPTIHRLVDPQGKVRLLVFALGNNGSFVRSISEDDGRTWSPMTPAGFKGVVPPMTVLPVAGGKKLLTWTHDSGRILNVLQCESLDGGLTWSKPTQPIDKRRFPNAFPCEPEVIRSPDGKQLLMLMRENNRRYNALFAVSDDEGRHWSQPRELPAALTGDRHTAVYAADGRLVVMFRDRRPVPRGEANHEKGGMPVWGSGKTTVWVGRYEDILADRQGQYLVRVLGYGGYGKLARLPNGSLLGITYCVYRPKGEERSSIVSTRFKLEETDAMLAGSRQRAGPGAAQRPVAEGKEEEAQAGKEP